MRKYEFVFVFICVSATAFAQLGIGTTTPDSKAQLDIVSTDKGLLIPRLNNTQMSNITNPTTSLLVFNTTQGKYMFYNGSSWEVLNNNIDYDWVVSGNNIYNANVGNVGVNVSNPVNNFEVNGYSFTHAGGNISTLFGTPTSVVTIGVGDDSTFTSGNAILHVKNAGNRGALGHVSGSDLLRLDFNNATAMLVNKYGNVSIGTDNPTSKLTINGQVTGGFGATTTGGTVDWNHSTNARSGSGYSLLYGNATHGFASGAYYHPFNFEYGSKNGTGNMTQLAIPYAIGSDASIYLRTRYSGSWSNWSKILAENTSGNVGIGTIAPTSKLEVNGQVKITGGTPGANKVLTSDATGLGSWVDPNTLVSGDNLGNHTATTTLNMGANAINSNAGVIRDANGGWVRTYGNTGWYNGTYGGGWYMTDASWLRAYNNKGVYTAGEIQAGGVLRSSVSRRLDFGTSDYQYLYGDNSSALYSNSNHSTVTQLILRDKEGVNYGRLYGDGNGANFGLLDGDGNWSYLAVKDNYTAFKINNSEKVRINSLGNVGIGTTSPAANLHIVGSIRIVNGTQASGRVLQSDANGTGSWVDTSTFGVQKIDDLSDGKSDNSSVFLGGHSGENSVSNIDNTGVGMYALNLNTSGRYNTAIGNHSLYNNTDGEYNTANGWASLYYNSGGDDNTANGIASLFNNTIGHFNTANGSHSLYDNTTGGNNTATGGWALKSNTTGSYNTALGYSAFYSITNLTNATAIGYGSQPPGSNTIRIGNGPVNSIGGYANWTNVSDRRFKKQIKENVIGLDFIKKLRPVTYHLDMDAIAQYNKTPDSLRLKDAEELKEKEIQSGFIAQDVEQAALAVGYDFHGVDKPKSEKDHYGLRYAEFVVPLVKGMQEQQKIIEEQSRRIENQSRKIKALETENKALLKRIERIEKALKNPYH